MAIFFETTCALVSASVPHVAIFFETTCALVSASVPSWSPPHAGGSRSILLALNKMRLVDATARRLCAGPASRPAVANECIHSHAICGTCRSLSVPCGTLSIRAGGVPPGSIDWTPHPVHKRFEIVKTMTSTVPTQRASPHRRRGNRKTE